VQGGQEGKNTTHEDDLAHVCEQMCLQTPRSEISMGQIAENNVDD
jgi:hypothetical protein